MAIFPAYAVELKTGKEILYRALGADDSESLLNFRPQIASESTNTMQYVGQIYPSIKETAQRLEAQLADKNILNIGAYDNNQLIGYLNFRLPYHDHPWAFHVAQFGMMILKDYWGLGIGKELLKIQEDYAIEIGVKRIEAMVRAQNTRGVNLYKKCGYIIEGTRNKAAFINNEFIDEYFIAKII
ncbi:MAG: GNAT family N-acetyltransferase [Bdellovibrionaceae bacterium]|nr:GNAT family N-acetyltransferase [Pseudobdellovibrionaceae bacterium]